MKKSVIALILLAVLIIIVSPGIVGKLAENSVGESLNWAAEESGEIVVTSDAFDRGWFSSEGQHRVTLGQGQLRSTVTDMAGADDDALPVLLINTHIDHGLIPLTSMSREQGSLMPGLGSAVSTLAIELGDGETINIPGTIYSEVGLAGDLDSRYIVEAGTHVVEDGEISWQATTINVITSERSSNMEFNGDIGPMTFGNETQVVAIDGVKITGKQARTAYGFNVGDVDMRLGEITISSTGVALGGMKGLNVMASSSVDDGRAAAAVRMELSGQTVPGYGDISVIADLDLAGLDAKSLGAVTRRLNTLANNTDPAQILAIAEPELKDLFAAGFDMSVEQFDVALPMGTVETQMSFEFPGSDGAAFEWTSLLLSSVANINVRVPEALVQFASSVNPQAGALVGMGYLKKDGDIYIMDADFKKGLLTINGAPIPIPMGAFQ